ncbi:unnamed protein product [Mucor hiemalis]
MTRRTFAWIYQLLSEHPAFQLVAPNATPVYQQVACVLWRFGSGHLGYMMQKSFLGFGQGSYHNFSNRFLDAMMELSNKLVVWPKTTYGNAHGFKYPHGEFTTPQNKRLPGCIGTVDGKRLNIYKAKYNPESYRDRKGHLSLNIIAICDSNLELTYGYLG